MPPVVLGIDTSSSWCSVALLDGGATVVRREEVGNAHSQKVLGMVQAVLDEAERTLVDCHVLAYGAGPGSFTGLRIAAAVAQGLAYGAGLPIASIGTLDAIANSVPDGERDGSVLVAQDARMGEIYWALFGWTDGGPTLRAGPSLVAPAALRDALQREGIRGAVQVGCGNAWAIHGAAMAGLVARVEHRESADAVDVARLGADAWRRGVLHEPAEAGPLYVRNDVAQTTAERRAARLASRGAAGTAR